MSNWQTASLEEMTPPNTKYGIVDGPFGSNLKTIHYKTSGIPIITSGFVTDGVFCADKYLYVNREKYETEKRSSVSGGDIVMAKIGARCGASAMLPHDHETGILSGNALKITIDKNRYSAKLVWQILWMLYRNGSLEKLKTVGAQPAISMSSLKKLKLTLPDLNEQNRIVTVLDTWGEYLEKLDKKIEIKKQIKKSLMQQFFTGRKRLLGFDEEWSMTTLSVIASKQKNAIVDGPFGSQMKLSEFTSSGIPVIEMHHLKDSIIDKASIKRYVSLEKFHNDLKRSGVVDGDIVVSKTGSLGYTGLVKGMEQAVITSRLAKITLDSRVADTSYIFHYLRYMRGIGYWERTGQGGTMKILSISNFSKMPVPAISLGEQKLIGEMLDSLDRELSVTQSKYYLIKNQRDYLLSKLVSGKIRVPEKSNTIAEVQYA